MSAGRLRSTRKLRSRSVALFSIPHPLQHHQAAGAHDVQDAVTVADGERPRGAAARMAARDVRGERDRPDTDRVAILEAVVDARGRVANDPDPNESPQRQEDVGVVAARGEGVGARVAGPQLGAGRLLEHGQPAPVVGVRLRVQEHFDVLDVEAELRDARHDHRRGAGIAAVEHDVALGPGDEEGRDVVRADVVEVAGDAERFGGLLPADLCRVQPPADDYQRKSAQHSQQDD